MTQRNEQRCRRCGGYAVPTGTTIHTACDVTDRTMLLQLCASLALCDHMGDVSNDVLTVLQWAGVAVDTDTESWTDAVCLALHNIGIGTIHGTSVERDEP